MNFSFWLTFFFDFLFFSPIFFFFHRSFHRSFHRFLHTNSLGGSFTHPGSFKLYTRIDIHQSQALTKDQFVTAVLGFDSDDMDLLRVLLAVDRVTCGGLGGLFKEWRGVDFVHWRNAQDILEKGKKKIGMVGGKKLKLTSLVKARNSKIGTSKH